MRSLALAGAALVAAPSLLHAQFADAWVEFTPDPSRISAPTVSNNQLETDLAWGDLDQNGLEDLVVVRVEPIMGGDPRRNLLLMNEGGVLVDRTALYATASDVPGDGGFLTPTADRDVVVVDVDGDGWLDVVTAVGFGLVADPVPISHPRVYMNLGDDGAGNWLGLRYEQARIPVLINAVSGLPVAARFNAVAAGDVTGDGFVDLYFGDHDASPTSIFGGEPATLDTDDRLLVNDGTGFFVDATASSLTGAMVASNFCNSAAIGDFDGDGSADIAKQTNFFGGGTPRITVNYNDGPPSEGNFSNLQQVYTGSPYFISTGELNGDGRLDLVVSENGLDGVIYNTATVGGQAVWSNLVPFEFLAGGDDSFASNSLVADLDGDGRNEALITDVDPQFSGFNRRLHIYHNRGNALSGAAILREEREQAGPGGWVGVVGMTDGDMNGTHDVAVFDVSGDGLDDLVVSRNSGTLVWVREPTCQPSLGFGSPGIVLEVCGNKLAGGNEATLSVSGAQPFGVGFVLVAAASTPTFFPELQETIAAFPPLLILSRPTGASGGFSIPVPGGGGPTTLVVQALTTNGLPTLLSASNAVAIEFLED